MWLHVTHIVESAMKLGAAAATVAEALVSKANHKNVAVW